MNFLNEHAAFIVLGMLTSGALSLVVVLRLQRLKNDRKKYRAIDTFFGKNVHPTSNEHDGHEATLKALLSQAVTGTQQAARAINEAQGRLEAVSVLISRLEVRLADSNQQHAKDSSSFSDPS